MPVAGPQQQASHLTVSELAAQHDILLDEVKNLWDRNMAGAFFVLRVHQVQVGQICSTQACYWQTPDPNMPEFLELSISNYKTKAANAWLGGLLSAVAPAFGATFEDWASVWLSVRDAVGAPLSDGLPLMPAPDMAGDPTKRPISTREVSGWIKLLLNRRCIDVGERSVSSHSAKATTLSYLAKHEQT